jgi:hypothetical protein
MHIEELDFRSGAIQKEEIQTDKPHDFKGGGQEKKNHRKFWNKNIYIYIYIYIYITLN